MNTKRIALLTVYAVIAVASMFGIINANSDRAEFIIKASIQASTQDEDYVGLLAFKEYVEKTSNGRVQVQLLSLIHIWRCRRAI